MTLEQFLKTYKPLGKIVNSKRSGSININKVSNIFDHSLICGGFRVYNMKHELLWKKEFGTCLNEIVKDISRQVKRVSFYVVTPDCSQYLVIIN